MLRLINYKIILLLSVLFNTFLHAQDTLWTRRFDQFRSEEAYDMAEDTSDNIIIVGTSQDTGIISDVLLLKYNQTGNLIWHRLFDTGQIDWGWSLTVVPNGNIIVASYHSDMITEKPGLVKFSSNGETLWSRMYLYPSLENVVLWGVALDSLNNIFACGFSLYSPQTVIIKSDTSGNLLWTRCYNWADEPGFKDIALDEDGNLIITGWSGSSVLLVAKFNNNGDSIWTRRYSGIYPATDGTRIVMDNANNIVVCGYGTDWSNYDALIIKYSPSGSMLWDKCLNFRPFDTPWGLAVDLNNNIFVSGFCGVLDTFDYFLSKFSPAGETLWTRFYNGPYNDVASGVVVDDLNNPIISGRSYNGADYDVLTIKYHGSSGIEEWANRENVRNNNDYLFRYNSIKSGQGIINLEVLKPSKYKITVYNTLGAVVKSIYSGYLQQGKHNFNLAVNQNGIYFLRIENEWGENSHKIIFLK